MQKCVKANDVIGYIHVFSTLLTVCFALNRPNYARWGILFLPNLKSSDQSWRRENFPSDAQEHITANRLLTSPWSRPSTVMLHLETTVFHVKSNFVDKVYILCHSRSQGNLFYKYCNSCIYINNHNHLYSLNNHT